MSKQESEALPKRFLVTIPNGGGNWQREVTHWFKHDDLGGVRLIDEKKLVAIVYGGFLAEPIDPE
jgi:hypothetical protein